MKTFKLNQILFDKTSNCYSLKVGNGYLYTFNSEKKATQFVNQLNKFLTEKLTNINFVYSEVFTMYRLCWFNFYSNKKSFGFKIAQSERDIKSNFSSVEYLLEHSYKISDNPNGNYHSIQMLQKSIEYLISNLLILSDLNKKNSNTGNIYKISFLLSQLNHIVNEINVYQQVNASSKVEFQNTEIIDFSSLLNVC